MRVKWRTGIALSGVGFLLGGAAFAACPGADAVDQRVAAYLAKQPMASYGEELSIADGYCAQALFVERLEAAMGPRIGFKVGFTGKASQERFKVTEPARGTLFKPMLLDDGAEIDAAFGVGPRFEADLMVRIKDEGINQATTPIEAAAHISEVVPFIELPDVAIAKGEPMTAAVIIAVNVLPRHGVLGKAIAVEASPQFVDAFAAMSVVMTDDTGKEYTRATGAALLGNPLNALLWLVQNLKAAGDGLKAGELVSLGSLGDIYPPEAGRTITLRYDGLPAGTGTVSVRFR